MWGTVAPAALPIGHMGTLPGGTTCDVQLRGHNARVLARCGKGVVVGASMKTPTCVALVGWHVGSNATSVMTTKPPTLRTMERWLMDGVARATDGCRVEPDGTCQHGHPSWLIRLGYI